MRARVWTMAAMAVAVLGLTACGGGSDGTGGDETTAPTTGSTGVSETSPEPAGEYTIVAPVDATNLGFDPSEMEVPQGEALSISFENQDPGIPHNVVVYEGDEAKGTPVFSPAGGKTITGVADTVYELDALDAGTYTYICSVHPTTMIGTMTAA